MLFDVQDRDVHVNALCTVVRPLGGPVSYVLEATVKDLQLLAGETCLGFELLQALGAMADCR